MKSDVDVVLDLNGHTLTMTNSLYLNAYTCNMKLSIENGTILTTNAYNALRIRGTEDYLAVVQLNNVKMINTNTETGVGLYIEDQYSQVSIEDCYFYTANGYAMLIRGEKALSDGKDNTIKIKNSTLIGTTAGISNSSPDAESPRIIVMDNSSIQSTGNLKAFIGGGSAVRIPDDQVIYCNGVLSAEQKVYQTNVVQVGKEGDFHELKLTASEDCSCVVVPSKTSGKFLGGKTIILSASTAKSYSFLQYKTSDGSTDGFADCAGNENNTQAVTGYQMPDTDVEVCAYFKIPGAIGKIDLSGFVFPTTEITAGDSTVSVEKTDTADTEYEIFTPIIFPADVTIEGKTPVQLNNVINKALESDDSFEYGKEYNVVSVIYYDGTAVTLKEDAEAVLNGCQMIKSYEDSTPATLNFACYYLPVQVNWCGNTLSDKVTWYFDTATGELKLEGNGSLADFSTSDTPWESHLEDIKRVTIGASVSGVKASLFTDMISLATIEVKEDNPEIASIDGVLYEKRDGVPITLLFIPPNVTTCDIPGTVTGVAKNAGANAGMLKEILLGQNVAKIEENAFSGCKNLESITILNPKCEIFAAKETIYENAKIYGYSGSTAAIYANRYNRERKTPNELGREQGDHIVWNYDTSSKTLTISGNGKMVDFAGDAPWQEDENIVTECRKVVIEDGITSVGKEAFVQMNFQELVLGKDVSEIGTMAVFSFNSTLRLIVVSKDNVAYDSDGIMLYTKDRKTLIYYAAGDMQEELTVPDGTEQISTYAFLGAKYLKKINLPESLKSIGEGAFVYTGLTEITIPKNVKNMDDFVVGGCNKLEKITFLGNVDTMGDDVFGGILVTNINVFCHMGTNACKKVVIAGFTKINNIHFYETIIDKVATEAEEGSCHEECSYCHDKKESVVIPKISKRESSGVSDTKESISISADSSKNGGEQTADNIVSAEKSAKAVIFKSVKNKKNKKIILQWKKITNVSGYQIQYAENQKFKKAKSKWAKKKSSTYQIKMQKKRTYYIRIRAYKISGKAKIYGKWSNVKKIKVKK